MEMGWVKGKVILEMSHTEARWLLEHLYRYKEYRDFVCSKPSDDSYMDLINALLEATSIDPIDYWAKAKTISDEVIRRFKIDNNLP